LSGAQRASITSDRTFDRPSSLNSAVHRACSAALAIVSTAFQPNDEIVPEPPITLPRQEGRRSPMRTAVGGEDGAPSAADRAYRNEGVAVDRGQETRLGAKHGPVIAEKARPVLEPGHDGMVGI